MHILVIAEHDNQTLKTATLHNVTAAQLLGGDVTVLVAGYQCDAVATQAANIAGIKSVIAADASVYANGLAENLADLITKLASEFTYLLAPATAFGKNLMPRVAALLDVAQISAIVKVISADTFVRPIYAGNALATVQSHDAVKVITVRSKAFVAAGKGSHAVPIVKTDIVNIGLTTFVKRELPSSFCRRSSSARSDEWTSSPSRRMASTLAPARSASSSAFNPATTAGSTPSPK